MHDGFDASSIRSRERVEDLFLQVVCFEFFDAA